MDFYGAHDGTPADQLAADTEARRQLSLQRALRELPRQIAGVGVRRYGGIDPRAGTLRDPLAMSIRQPPEGEVVTPAMVQQELQGPGPGYGPENVANWIEDSYGTLEERPSWNSARQFAQAGAAYARARDDGGNAGPLTSTLADEYRKSQHLMTPARAAYMKGPGRAVDVLRFLNKDPERAMYFFDRSAPEEIRDGRPSERNLTRTDYSDPIYQRFGEDNVTPFLLGVSPIAVALRKMNYLPQTWSFYAAESPTMADALKRSWAAGTQASRTRSGENPIGDLRDGATAQENVQRLGELAARAADVNEPPAQNFANSVVAKLYDYIPHVSASAWAGRPLREEDMARSSEPPKASAAVRDVLDAARGYADASSWLSGAIGLLRPKSLLPALLSDLKSEAAFEIAARQAFSPGLPEDPAAYISQGLDSVPLDTAARQRAADGALADQALNPQSIYDERMKADPEFGSGVLGMGRSLLESLRGNAPSARAFGGQPIPK